MGDSYYRYLVDIERAARKAEVSDDTEAAASWRRQAADFIVGRTNCHNWASAKRAVRE